MTALLTDAQIAERLAERPGWRLAGAAICREFTFSGFPDAVAFVGRLVALAEAADHHPDLAIHHRRVVVTFTTHSAGGLTTKDFAGARAVDGAAGEGALQSTATAASEGSQRHPATTA